MDKTELIKLLSLKQIDDSTFQSITNRENSGKAIFGGQVLAQALLAAYETVSSRPVHSLHAYFLSAGSPKIPVCYEVECLRDGRAMSSRRVVAKQNDKVIFHLSASFHVNEPGYQHQDTSVESLALFQQGPPSPDEPAIRPSTAGSDIEIFGFEIYKFESAESYKPEMNFWFRVKPQLQPDIAVQHAALAYISDMRLIATAVLPHPTKLLTKELQIASIDHAIWFHEQQFTVNDWMFCKMHSPWSGNSRGLVKGEIFSSSGALVASVNQEGLLRQRLG